MVAANEGHRNDFSCEGGAAAPVAEETGQLTPLSDLAAVIDSFASPNLDHAFGYGSGVFAQSGNRGGMLDLILSVSDAKEFHAENLRSHPDHYSLPARLFGPGFVSVLQRSDYGGKVWFNPLVPSSVPSRGDRGERRLIKYGTIETSDLLKDLREWDRLYVAGRMHKPVVVVGEGDQRVVEAQERYNLRYALSAGLLLLGGNIFPSAAVSRAETGSGAPDSTRTLFDLSSLYEMIASLSYIGDPRMSAGAEDPDKVSKLVVSPGQSTRWWSLYESHLCDFQRKGLLSVHHDGNAGAGQLEFDIGDGSLRRELWQNLPPRLRSLDEPHCTGTGRLDCRSKINPPNAASLLTCSIAAIVGPASRYQSAKGLVTAGLVRSTHYMVAKLAKGAFSRLRKS